MPLIVPDQLPASQALKDENIFVMNRARAQNQNIRPLKIIVLNLMPTKIATETQLARVLANSPLQVEMNLLTMDSHMPTHISQEHMEAFYKTLDEVKKEYFDGLIITGSPVEHLPFKEVDYWDELCDIFEFARTHVYSTMFLCWGAQAALNYYYGIKKYPLDKKIFGVFRHNVERQMNPLMRGFDERFYAPHSRHTEIRREDIEAVVNSIEPYNTQTIIDTLYYGSEIAFHNGIETSVAIALRYPERKVVLAHSGSVEFLKCMMATRYLPNVYYDYSFIQTYFQHTSLRFDMVDFLRRTANRIMFGSDYPSFTLDSAIENMKSLADEAGISGEKLAMVMGLNAEKVFGL